MISDRHLLLLALGRAAFLRAHECYKLAQRWSTVKDLERADLEIMRGILGRGIRITTWQPARWIAEARGDGRAIDRGELNACFLGETGYPRLLEVKLTDPPVVLYWKGRKPLWGAPMIGVVGTRKPTGRAREAAAQTGAELAQMGIAVVSGLARGIDRNAHQGCIESGGTAIAVLGCGIDRIYPPSNLVLARRILERGGCMVGEYPPGVQASRHHFPARNRIISGLCQAIVVIQAPERSGALITADHALDQGVDLVVHEAGLWGVEGAGTRDLADSGAPVIQTATDLITGAPVRQSEPQAAIGGRQ